MRNICPVCKKEIEPLAAIIGKWHAGCAPLKEIPTLSPTLSPLW